MIGYVMLGTNDLVQARAFYDPLMAKLGAVPGAWTSERSVFYVNGNQPMLSITKPFDGEAATAGNGTMVGLPAASRELVDELYAWALANGATDEGAPGIRGGEGSPFYGSYLRDALGNKLCIFNMAA